MKGKYRPAFMKITTNFSPSLMKLTKRWSKQANGTGSRDFLDDKGEPEAACERVAYFSNGNVSWS